jgi:hypothetical protein
MWYSVQRAYELTEGLDFDCYIRTRFDLKYEESLLDLSKLDLSSLHVYDWDTNQDLKHRGHYDVFAIGNKINIGVYSHVFSKVDWYLNYDEEYVKFLHGDSGLRNEYLLKWHLRMSGISTVVHENSIPHADGHVIR